MMLYLDSMARRYNCRPHQILGMPLDYKALCIDIWAHTAGVQEETNEAKRQASAMKRAGRGRRGH